MAIVGIKSNKTERSGFFEGCRFIIELGVISQSKKKEFHQSIEANGGTIDFVVSKKVLPSNTLAYSTVITPNTLNILPTSN